MPVDAYHDCLFEKPDEPKTLYNKSKVDISKVRQYPLPIAPETNPFQIPYFDYNKKNRYYAEKKRVG
jgi:hypothetical protein